MTKNVNIERLHILESMLDNPSRISQYLKDYFTKKTHKSRKDEYKPGSDKYMEEVLKDEKIAQLPDYKVDMNDTLVIEYSYHKAEFTMGKLTLEETVYYDYEDYEETVVREYTFLVKNSYWGEGLITTFNALLCNEMVQSLLIEKSKAKHREYWVEYLNSERLGNGTYILLLDEILKAENDLIEVGVYFSMFGEPNEYLKIGDDKYYAKDMVAINEAYKADEPIYDEHDRRVEYNHYSHGNYVQFYNTYIKPKCD
jgi:hypothetical protein